MTSILEQRVTDLLTTELGRAPTAAEIANGLIAPWTLSQTHNTLNVTQSLLAVNPGDDLQAAVDQLVSNGGGILFLNPVTYNLTDNLVLASNIHLRGVGSNGSIIDFGGGAFQVQLTGSLGNEIVSPFFEALTLQNSSTDLINGTYINNLGMNDLTCRSGLTGMNLSHIETANITSSLQDSCGTGMAVANSELFTIISTNSTNCTSGGGVALDTVSNSVSIACSVDACVGGGYLFTNCSNFGFENFAVTNITGVGIDFNGGGAGFALSLGFIDSCSSDGVSIHDSATGITLTAANTFTNNGGYGINIASGSADNLIVGNRFASNTSGAVNNGGTGTLIRSNIGVSDSP